MAKKKSASSTTKRSTKKAAKKKAPAAKKKTPAAKKKAATAKKTAAARAPARKSGTPGKRAPSGVSEPETTKKKHKAKTKIKSPYTARELRVFRDRLLSLREAMSGQISALKDASLERRDKRFTEEDGTEAFDRDFALNLARSEQDAVFEIDEALRRIEQRTYGICEMTGKQIEKPRLEAIPYTRLCVEAQAELEKKERGQSTAHRTVVSRSAAGYSSLSSQSDPE